MHCLFKNHSWQDKLHLKGWKLSSPLLPVWRVDPSDCKLYSTGPLLANCRPRLPSRPTQVKGLTPLFSQRKVRGEAGFQRN